jgi:hypothetical protein
MSHMAMLEINTCAHMHIHTHPRNYLNTFIRLISKLNTAEERIRNFKMDQDRGYSS